MSAKTKLSSAPVEDITEDIWRYMSYFCRSRQHSKIGTSGDYVTISKSRQWGSLYITVNAIGTLVSARIPQLW